jgi:hypothetical protein
VKRVLRGALEGVFLGAVLGFGVGAVATILCVTLSMLATGPGNDWPKAILAGGFYIGCLGSIPGIQIGVLVGLATGVFCGVSNGGDRLAAVSGGLIGFFLSVALGLVMGPDSFPQRDAWTLPPIVLTGTIVGAVVGYCSAPRDEGAR